jgi:CheY-like chemotaxis protein
MKKILLSNEVKDLFLGKSSFLDRADIAVLTAATNAEALKIHHEKVVDLMVLGLDAPGIKTEVMLETIRNSHDLQKVSTLIICNDTLAHRERCKQCHANAFFTKPVDTALLSIKMQQLLNVALRMSYRAPLAVAIQGSYKDKPLPFWTENISSSGLLIRAEEPLSRGDGIFFSFFLPDGTHVSGYGEITRVVPPGEVKESALYGIKLTNVEPDVQSAIDAVVKKNLKE